MTWLFVFAYQKHISTQQILSLGSQRVIPLRLLLISDGLLRKKVLVSIKKHYRLHTKGNVLWCSYLSRGTCNSCPFFMLLNYLTLIVSYPSLKVTVSSVYKMYSIQSDSSAHIQADRFHHTGSSRIQLFPCAATNEPIKRHVFSEVLHKRHQLKAWIIISSMPLLPIKDRDGDKEASTAGRKQTDKTNMATQSVWKPPGFTVHSTSGPSPVGTDLWKPAKFDNHYVCIIHCWQGNTGNLTHWIHHRHWGLCYKAEWGVMWMIRYCIIH